MRRITRNKEPWIGQAVPRVEDASLLSGNARYIDDLSPVPGIKHVCFLRSPYPHARLIDIDTVSYTHLTLPTNREV